MSTAPKLTAPKNGRYVTSTQHEGVFEIVFAPVHVWHNVPASIY
jgi:hypothetical protein